MQERQQLKERQRAIEEAEQSRRRAVTVTFDLLGRQVGLPEIFKTCLEWNLGLMPGNSNLSVMLFRG